MRLVVREYTTATQASQSPILSIQAGTPTLRVSHLDVIFNCYVQRAPRACCEYLG